MNAPQNPTPAPAEPGNPRRKKALTAIAAVVVLGGLGFVAYEWMVGRYVENTDNAYVQGNVIQITPQIGGTVMAIMADDTDFVKAGQPLVRLDPADARVALEQAEANLAQAVRQVRTLYANNGTLAAQVKLREADVARAQTDIGRTQSEVTRAQADVARATEDLNRRMSLTANGAISREELAHTRTQLSNAQSALSVAQSGVKSAQAGVQSAQAAGAAAREQLVSNQAMTDGTAVEQHPSVLAAAAKMREAYLASQRAVLPAPVDGFVARRTVQLGQRVAAGTPMMSVVPLNQVWVDANFKEVQLRNIRIGQPATLTADVYGKKVVYTGTVAGMGVGTGAAFSLLPAQNATGNWIKVVQRVPVRIALDSSQLAAHPLRIGLSMDVDVDIKDQQGKSLADAPPSTPPSTTAVYAEADRGADAEVQRVIAANLGRSAARSMAQARPRASARPQSAAANAARPAQDAQQAASR